MHWRRGSGGLRCCCVALLDCPGKRFSDAKEAVSNGTKKVAVQCWSARHSLVYVSAQLHALRIVHIWKTKRAFATVQRMRPCRAAHISSAQHFDGRKRGASTPRFYSPQQATAIKSHPISIQPQSSPQPQAYHVQNKQAIGMRV